MKNITSLMFVSLLVSCSVSTGDRKQDCDLDVEAIEQAERVTKSTCLVSDETYKCGNYYVNWIEAGELQLEKNGDFFCAIKCWGCNTACEVHCDPTIVWQ